MHTRLEVTKHQLQILGFKSIVRSVMKSHIFNALFLYNHFMLNFKPKSLGALAPVLQSQRKYELTGRIKQKGWHVREKDKFRKAPSQVLKKTTENTKLSVQLLHWREHFNGLQKNLFVQFLYTKSIFNFSTHKAFQNTSKFYKSQNVTCLLSRWKYYSR